MARRSSRAWRQDQTRRSKQKHERGLGAKRKGNPRYMRKSVYSRKLGGYVDRYVLRDRR